MAGLGLTKDYSTLVQENGINGQVWPAVCMYILHCPRSVPVSFAGVCMKPVVACGIILQFVDAASDVVWLVWQLIFPIPIYPTPNHSE